MEAPPAPVISTEYDAEEDEGDSDEDNIPDAPQPPVISKQEVIIIIIPLIQATEAHINLMSTYISWPLPMTSRYINPGPK